MRLCNKETRCYNLADTTSILSKWEHFFSNLLNFNQSNNKLSEIYTEEPDIPEPSLIEVELTIENLKKHKAPGVHHIPLQLIQAGGDKLCEEIHILTVLIWNKEELPQEWKETIIVPINKKGDRMDF